MALSFELMLQARRLLDLNQRTLADLLGVSGRTVQRWDAGRSSGPVPAQLHVLAAAVYEKNPELAQKIALAAGTTVDLLGLVPAPAPAPKAPVGRAVPDGVVMDAIVCVAAEALQTSPSAVRPALLAAFRRAHEVGLTTAEAASLLAPPAPARSRSRA
jgi:transcriptional regulator with XRE-family HTH domain